MSLDQRPFIFHDWTMRRMTGWRLPLELTPASIVRTKRLAGTDERVPTLDEVLDALPEGPMLAVDVKAPWAVIPLIRRVKARELQKRVLVWCTSAWAVRYAVRAAPDVEVAYLKDVLDADEKRDFIAKARTLGAKAVSAHWMAIDAEFVAAAHALGLKVYSYNQGFELSRDKLSAGLDGIITDTIAAALAAVGGVT
jgi:glycerophosphoryl diester phosphodiesterase